MRASSHRRRSLRTPSALSLPSGSVARRSPRFRVVRGLGVVVVLAIAVVAGGYPVYVDPQLDPVTHADAVVVLGGSDVDGRAEHGLELVQAGVADQLVLSNPYGSARTTTARICRGSFPGIDVSCFAPDPSTTQGEAQQIRALAAERGWHDIVVVTGVYHVSRARWIISRCYDGGLTMTAPASRPTLQNWVYQYAYQTLGYAKAALRTGC